MATSRPRPIARPATSRRRPSVRARRWKHAGHQQRLRHVPRHRQELHRGVESQDQAGQPPADHGELRELPRGRQLHELRRHEDEPCRHHQRLHHLSRGEPDRDRVHRGDAEGAGHMATSRPRADCATCHKSTTAVRSGHGDEPRRHQQRLRDLPRHGQELHRGDRSSRPSRRTTYRRRRAARAATRRPTSRASPARR